MEIEPEKNPRPGIFTNDSVLLTTSGKNERKDYLDEWKM